MRLTEVLHLLSTEVEIQELTFLNLIPCKEGRTGQNNRVWLYYSIVSIFPPYRYFLGSTYTFALSTAVGEGSPVGMPVDNEVMKSPCLGALNHSLSQRKCIFNGAS